MNDKKMNFVESYKPGLNLKRSMQQGISTPYNTRFGIKSSTNDPWELKSNRALRTRGAYGPGPEGLSELQPIRALKHHAC